MTNRHLVLTPGDRPTPLGLVGEQLTVLASGDQTGSFEIFLQSGGEGAGPPPHSHGWDEAFYVLRGDVTFGVGDDTGSVGPGTLVYVPGGATHWFRLGEGGAEMLSITSREGAARFFTDVDAQIPRDAVDIGKLVEIATSHGLTVAPPPG